MYSPDRRNINNISGLKIPNYETEESEKNKDVAKSEKSNHSSQGSQIMEKYAEQILSTIQPTSSPDSSSSSSSSDDEKAQPVLTKNKV